MFFEREGHGVPALVTNRHVVESVQSWAFHLNVAGRDGMPVPGGHVRIASDNGTSG